MSFQRTNALGKAGERVIKNLMEQRNHEVIDVSDNEVYWSKDIDFIIDGHSVELKTDKVISKTENLFLEYELEYFKDGSKKDGYFYFSEAEYLFYFDILNRVLYIYDFAQLKKYVKEHLVPTRSLYDTNKRVTGFILYKEACPPTQIIDLKEVS